MKTLILILVTIIILTGCEPDPKKNPRGGWTEDGQPIDNPESGTFAF